MKLKLQYKRPLFIFLMIAVIAVSIKPLIFAYHYLLANYYSYVKEDKMKAHYHIFRNIRYNPKIHDKVNIENGLLKAAILFQKKELLNRIKQSEILQFYKEYKDNFYFQNMFDNLKAEKNWEHLDELSYYFLSKPSANQLTQEILEKSNIEFSRAFLINLLDFLKWQKNDRLFKYISNKYDLSDYIEIKPKSCVTSEFSINRLKKIVTEKLKVYKNNIGSNMINSGAFDRENLDNKNWIFYAWSEPPLFGQSSFFVEKEKVNNNNMIRSFNPYINNSVGKSIARAGLWYKKWVKLKKGYYIFSFDYWTKTGREDLRFWLGQGTDVIRLIDTKSRWQKVVYILDNTKGRVKGLRPLIRMYGTGSLWFDNVFLGKLAVKELSQEDKNFYILYIKNSNIKIVR